uniref:SP110 nuclear body protein, tandem duplicate 1 n=1 Tax=Mola mola TaxID=94237 RepID=A0A3Q3VKM5_MOLML
MYTEWLVWCRKGSVIFQIKKLKCMYDFFVLFCFLFFLASPLKKGEKGDIWTWPIYKVQLPVTCGELEGMLDRERLAKGEKCIFVNNKWFTPTEFERAAGKQNSKNWKLTIRCANTPLVKLIQIQMRSLTWMTRHQQAEMKLPEILQAIFRVETPYLLTHTVIRQTAFDVCPRTCAKSIRTETSWMTPVDFVKEALCQTDASWRKDIKWEGKPLSHLRSLPSSLLCMNSDSTKPARSCQENQKNDDECCICRSEEEHLVVCDQCPRSFHQKCHLPHHFIISGLQLQGYSAVIKTPMWLGSIADKFQQQLYQTVGEFVSDVQLIFTNSAAYNQVRNSISKNLRKTCRIRRFHHFYLLVQRDF